MTHVIMKTIGQGHELNLYGESNLLNNEGLTFRTQIKTMQFAR